MKKLLWSGALFLGWAMVFPSLLAAGKTAIAAGNGLPPEFTQSQQVMREYSGPQQNLITSDHFLGSPVQGASGEALGYVSQVVFDSTGQIRYLVVRTPEAQDGQGGVHLVPWAAVKTDEPRVISIEVTREQFRKAPEGLSVATQDREEELHRFYGVAPYWQEDQEQTIERRPREEDQGYREDSRRHEEMEHGPMHE